jgi:hypothetical protein
MAFDWREYLALAQWLQTNTPSGMTREGACRCGISRAYYAAFGYAIAYARDYLGFRPRDDTEDHGRLRAHLKQKRRQATSDSLDRLRGWRNDCDYFDDFTGNLEDTLIAAIREARYVYDSLPAPPPLSTPQSPPNP